MASVQGTSALEANVRIWHLAVPCLLGAINAVGNISGYVAPQAAGSVVLLAGLAIPLAAHAAEARRSARLEAV